MAAMNLTPEFLTILPGLDHPHLEAHLLKMGRPDLAAKILVPRASFDHFVEEFRHARYGHIDEEGLFTRAVVSAYFHPNHCQEKKPEPAPIPAPTPSITTAEIDSLDSHGLPIIHVAPPIVNVPPFPTIPSPPPISTRGMEGVLAEGLEAIRAEVAKIQAIQPQVIHTYGCGKGDGIESSPIVSPSTPDLPPSLPPTSFYPKLFRAVEISLLLAILLAILFGRPLHGQTGGGSASSPSQGVIVRAQDSGGTNLLTRAAGLFVLKAGSGVTFSVTGNVVTINGAAGAVGGASNLTTVGAIPYVSSAGTLNQDQTTNNQLFWDATNHRLGIGTTSPSRQLHIGGGSFGEIQLTGGGKDWHMSGSTSGFSFVETGVSVPFSIAPGGAVTFGNTVTAVGSTWYNSTPTTGITSNIIRSGAGQSTTNPVLSLRKNDGTEILGFYEYITGNIGLKFAGSGGSSGLYYSPGIGTTMIAESSNIFNAFGCGSSNCILKLGGSTVATYTGASFEFTKPIKFSNTNSTAAVAGSIGSTCPAVTCTAAYTWISAVSSDGSTVYFPVWK